MKSYKKDDNEINIYTIYFGKESFWEYFKDVESHLKNIAKIGKTNIVYKPDNFNGLDKTLEEISKSINSKIGIKIQNDI